MAFCYDLVSSQMRIHRDFHILSQTSTKLTLLTCFIITRTSFLSTLLSTWSSLSSYWWFNSLSTQKPEVPSQVNDGFKPILFTPIFQSFIILSSCGLVTNASMKALSCWLAKLSKAWVYLVSSVLIEMCSVWYKIPNTWSKRLLHIVACCIVCLLSCQ